MTERTNAELTADVAALLERVNAHTLALNEVKDVLSPGIQQGFTENKKKMDGITSLLDEQVEPIIKNWPHVKTTFDELDAAIAGFRRVR